MKHCLYGDTRICLLGHEKSSMTFRRYYMDRLKGKCRWRETISYDLKEHIHAPSKLRSIDRLQISTYTFPTIHFMNCPSLTCGMEQEFIKVDPDCSEHIVSAQDLVEGDVLLGVGYDRPIVSHVEICEHKPTLDMYTFTVQGYENASIQLFNPWRDSENMLTLIV